VASEQTEATAQGETNSTGWMGLAAGGVVLDPAMKPAALHPGLGRDSSLPSVCGALVAVLGWICLFQRARGEPGCELMVSACRKHGPLSWAVRASELVGFPQASSKIPTLGVDRA